MAKKSKPRAAGRPRTTGSGSTQRIAFAVSDEQLAALKAAAKAAGLSLGQYAKISALQDIRNAPARRVLDASMKKVEP